jgi:drug/metabolite transporter (DMT)-like permease
VLIGVTMIWGFTFLVVQHALQWAGPFSFVSLRFGIAGLIALLLSWRELHGLTRRELLTGALVGSVLFGSYSLQTLGLQLIPSSKSAFLTGLYVPLVPLFQLLLFRHRPRLAAWLGIIVAFGGLVLLSDPRGLQFNFRRRRMADRGRGRHDCAGNQPGGPLCRPVPPAPGGGGAIAHRVLAGGTGLATQWRSRAAAAPGIAVSLLGMGLATAVIQIAMNWAQKTVPATRATVIYAMEPVWAGLLGALAGEQLGLMAISGAALIVASVLISQLGGRQGH